MRGLFFQKLAITGMKKNRQIYLPYLLTCILTVMMFYLLHSISYSHLLMMMKGGTSTEAALTLGKFVVAIFSFLFLWYSNSFLAKRRTKEFGLYNILGMGKRGLRKIMFWETLITAVIGIVGGLLFGFLFSKLAELCLANILRSEVTDYSFTFHLESFLFTAEIYGAIFAFLLIRSMIKVQISNPMELFRSENYGEKPPKANWLLAILGLLLLAGAYALAVSIKSPLAALFLFFVAVVMVIIATYLLFIAGSVAFCKILKSKKGYYYKKQHFVSLSSMIYRMKRNGAGLASICILSTMVLVMLSSTGSLYFGMNEAIDHRFFRQTEMYLNIYAGGTEDLNMEAREKIKGLYQQEFEKAGVTPKNAVDYACVRTEGVISSNSVIKLTGEEYGEDMSSVFSTSKFCVVDFISAQDYNRLMGTDLAPAAGEVFLYTNNCKFEQEKLTVDNFTWKVNGHVKSMFTRGNNSLDFVPYVVLILSDLNEANAILESSQQEDSPTYVTLQWLYCYDIDGTDEEVLNMARQLKLAVVPDLIKSFTGDENIAYTIYFQSKPETKKGMTDLYGGLFFIGVLLSFLFLMAAVLIIYYKQISEGYEDQGRFGIMKKVGMTTKDIKSSINSQVLTVFFAPLLMAGLHLSFAYPLIWRVLQLLMLTNLGYVILITVCIYAAFTVFYVGVYKWTAGTYYRIVGGNKK